MANAPYLYQLEAAASIVTLRYSEPATIERFRSTINTIRANPQYRPGMHFLIDRRAVHRAQTNEYVDQILSFLKEHPDQVRGARWAVLTDPHDLTVGSMSRLLGFRAGQKLGIEIDAFDDEGQARAWLQSGNRADP